MISTHDSAYKVTDQVLFRLREHHPSCGYRGNHRGGPPEAPRLGGTAPSMPVHLGCGTGGGSLHHPRGQGALNGRNL